MGREGGRGGGWDTPTKLSLLLGMLGGLTLPQGDEGLTVQAEGSRAMRRAGNPRRDEGTGRLGRGPQGPVWSCSEAGTKPVPLGPVWEGGPGNKGPFPRMPLSLPLQPQHGPGTSRLLSQPCRLHQAQHISRPNSSRSQRAAFPPILHVSNHRCHSGLVFSP